MSDGAEDARLRAVVELAQAMAMARSARETWRAAARGARRALGGSFAALSVWERGPGRLRVLVNEGERAPGEEEFPEDETYPVHRFPEITEFLHERWARGGAPHAWAETAEGPAGGGAGYCHQRVAALRRRGRGACVVAPLVLDGRAWGELYVARRAGAPVFGQAEAGLATVLAAVVAAGLAQLHRLEEARRLAFTDPLTGLANRRLVDQRLDEALERHRDEGLVLSLVVCDLNGLKRVNDTQGHAVGDHLLERFGCVLSRGAARLGTGTLAARLGGDEFCLLALGPGADEVVAVAEEICAAAYELDVGEGVACGVASTGDPIGPVASARRLFRLADAAQYEAKGLAARRPVVAGREGSDDPVVRLADAVRADPDDARQEIPGYGTTPAPPTERRRIRGRRRPGPCAEHPGDPGSPRD
ncbi:diguanylate cyclase domain-containing protein [Streptomyces sp. NPDC060243]|uniref:GGDEF domain-containing protein n=1 Tax=Streptomyces sp. NPDC060243 TaxID=3347081 RepID=UPI0036575875